MVKIDDFIKNRFGLGLRWSILSHAEKPKKLDFGDFQVYPKSAKIVLFGENYPPRPHKTGTLF